MRSAGRHRLLVERSRTIASTSACARQLITGGLHKSPSHSGSPDAAKAAPLRGAGSADRATAARRKTLQHTLRAGDP